MPKATKELETKPAKVIKKVSKELASPEPKRDKKLMWAGANKLLEKSTNKEIQKEKNAILVMSNMLGVSPFGINILGGVAYLNKLGRNQKLDQYGKGKFMIEYNWVQRALADNDKAICEARIVDRTTGLPQSAWITGESSPASMKMGTLAGYQNHLAQTRAHNRVIEEMYSVEIHQEMLENLGKYQMAKGESLPALDTGVSAEEISTQPRQAQKEKVIDVPEFECFECANPMNKAQVDFSTRMYGKQLCKDCQELAKKGMIKGVNPK